VGVTKTRTAVPLFYIFKKEVIPMLREFVEKESKLKPASQVGCGHFLEWLVSSGRHSMFTMNLPSGFAMIGASVGLKQYMELNRDFKEAQKGEKSVQITKRAYARVGLMGNPSDGFHGKTIALTIRNYWAQCTLTQSDKIRILPHPLYDPTEYPSLSSLYDVARREGYSGGIRLLTGTCKKFFEWCVRYGIALPDKKFSLSYVVVFERDFIYITLNTQTQVRHEHPPSSRSRRFIRYRVVHLCLSHGILSSR
jgi:glucuronokinase